MGKSIDKITNVLIFKDGYYWLTVNRTIPVSGGPLGGYDERVDKDSYQIANVEKNGFEFASDAYAYIVSLRPPLPIVEYDKEEERLKEMGEV